MLHATTLATLAMDEVLYLRSASTTIDLTERAIAAGLRVEPLRGQNWAILALTALVAADGLSTALGVARVGRLWMTLVETQPRGKLHTEVPTTADLAPVALLPPRKNSRSAAANAA